jgi:dolichyl-diphosphooligosaccharide--protein glycosyltransferase
MTNIKTILTAAATRLTKWFWPIGHKIWPLLKKIGPAFILSLILALSLWLRIGLSWGAVFQNPIKYSADDGVYHMRLIENMLLGGHFPHRIFFDPFTYFPYGTYIHFAPLYEYPLAWVIWLASFGHPTLDSINKIAPFYPPVLGTLAILVIYFIGRALWGKATGLMAAALSAISSTLIYRSLLGATDHHQAEYLYSSMAMLFLILAVTKPQGKKFLLWSILSGISLGLYFLAWKGALLFLLIIFIFITAYYLIEYSAGRVHTWILQAGLIIFTITLVAISFFFNHPDIWRTRLYDWRYAASLLGGIAVWLALLGLGKLFHARRIKPRYFFLTLILAILAASFGLKLAFPTLWQGMIDAVAAVNTGMTPYPLIRQLVGEMAPLTISGAFQVFSCLFYLSFITLVWLIIRFIKRRQPEHLLLIVWFATTVLICGIFWTAVGLRRYEYYLAIVVSLFCAFLIIKGLAFARRGLALWRAHRPSQSGIFLLVGSWLIIINIAYFTLYPFPLNLIETFPNNLPRIILNAMDAGKNGIMIVETDWYEAFDWLRNNTPDPGVDYYGSYVEPPFNPRTGKVFAYPYPDTAYGIVASWDVGHMLTYYAHRMPTANPFQLGIGKIVDEKIIPGEATFFIETDEAKAYKILDQLKTRYVITDFNGSYAYAAFPSKPEWVDNGSMNYYAEQNGQMVATDNYDKSMSARLYFLDGREWLPAKQNGKTADKIKALGRYRLVYESAASAATMPDFFNEKEAQLKVVKIFEYVAGAVIEGTAKSGTVVTISAKVTTNQKRAFVWQSSVTAGRDNKFSVRVPYSTDGHKAWEAKGTKLAVFASPYQLTIGRLTKTVKVRETDVMKGQTIKISK